MPDSSDANNYNASDVPSKKMKIDEPLSEHPFSFCIMPKKYRHSITSGAYGKEVQSYSGSGSLKDAGAGVRPLVK